MMVYICTFAPCVERDSPLPCPNAIRMPARSCNSPEIAPPFVERLLLWGRVNISNQCAILIFDHYFAIRRSDTLFCFEVMLTPPSLAGCELAVAMRLGYPAVRREKRDPIAQHQHAPGAGTCDPTELLSRPARCLGRGTRPARIPRAKDELGSPYAISACGVVGARRATCASQPRLEKLKASCWSRYAEWAAVCPVTVTPVSWKAQRERYQRTRSRRPTATR
jgi:hypothetical protein